MDRRVIGLVGPMASGKGRVAAALVAHDFVNYSLSDRVREAAGRRGLDSNDRETLQNMGDQLRLEFGGQVLAEMTARLVERDQSSLVVIDSIRNPAEIDYLVRGLSAMIVGVTASRETRWRRIQERKKLGDPISYEEFVRLEERDRGLGQAMHGQQVDICLERAHILIENETDREDLAEIARELLGRCGLESYSKLYKEK